MDLHFVFVGGVAGCWCTRLDCRADLCAGVGLGSVYKGELVDL